MKKLFTALMTVSLLCGALTACADTSNVDSIIAKQEAEKAMENYTPPETFEKEDSGSFEDVPTQAPAPEVDVLPDVSNGEYDVDLTNLDSNMIYAVVYDMVYNTNDYMGQHVKAKGTFSYYQDSTTGNEYFAVLISDATACCAQGIEFVLDGDYNYPDDYPEIGTEITVVGDFNAYEENYTTYVQLTDAEIVA